MKGKQEELQEDLMGSKRGLDDSAQRRCIQQLQTQLQDIMNSAAAQALVLRQQQHRREVQEKRNVALQESLQDLKLHTEGRVESAKAEMQANLALAIQQADER